MTGLLITGTDTGVGKTWVGCHLVKALVTQGVRVGVMKPCETGRAGGKGGQAGSSVPPGSDAERLIEASGCEAPISDVLPYLFRLPAAPSIAALEEGVQIDIDVLEAAYGRLRETHDIVIVEGAGGILVPLAPDLDYLDLALRLELETLVVSRTGLGTLNHTALTDRVLRLAGINPVGIVLNSPTKPVSGNDRVNLSVLGSMVGTRVLAEFPHGEPPSPSVMAPLLDSLLEVAGR